MNTGPQAIKIPYNQTADFDMSLNVRLIFNH